MKSAFLTKVNYLKHIGTKINYMHELDAMIDRFWTKKLYKLSQENNQCLFKDKKMQKKLVNSLDPKCQQLFMQINYVNDH